MIVVTACFRAETKAIRPREGVRIVRTAMGERSTRRLSGAFGNSNRGLLLLSTGFCGGLDPELHLGDVVLASAIRREDEVLRVDPRLIDRARAALDARGLAPHVGEVECPADVVEPAEKRALAARGAASVDLESGPLAHWAAANGISFLSCRVILDSADEEMPFSARVPLWISVLGHPLTAARMGHAAGTAADGIGAAVGCLLDAWEETR